MLWNDYFQTGYYLFLELFKFDPTKRKSYPEFFHFSAGLYVTLPASI